LITSAFVCNFVCNHSCLLATLQANGYRYRHKTFGKHRQWPSDHIKFARRQHYAVGTGQGLLCVTGAFTLTHFHSIAEVICQQHLHLPVPLSFTCSFVIYLFLCLSLGYKVSSNFYSWFQECFRELSYRQTEKATSLLCHCKYTAFQF